MLTRKSSPIPYLFILPAVVVMVLGLIIPVGNALMLSFFKWDMGTPWDTALNIGTENYTRLLADETVIKSLTVTLKYTLATTLLEMIAGIGLALALEKPIRGASVFRTIFILPLMISPIIVGLIWRYMLDTRVGIIPHYVELIGEKIPFLQNFGFVQQTFLADINLALPTVIAVDIWQWTPFIFIIILAGLQALPNDVIQAAYIDGASWWQMTTRVKLPMIFPLIIVTLLLRLVDVFRALEVLFVMTFGGPAQATEVLSVKIYKTAFAAQNLGYASTISMLLIGITLILSVLVLIYNNPLSVETENRTRPFFIALGIIIAVTVAGALFLGIAGVLWGIFSEVAVFFFRLVLFVLGVFAVGAVFYWLFSFISRALPKRTGQLGHYSLLFLLAWMILLPIYIILLTSIKKQVVVMSSDPVGLLDLFGEKYREVQLVGENGQASVLNLFSNYQTIFERHNFLRHLVSSVYVALASTLLTILVSSWSAYAIARMKFMGRGILANTSLLVRMVPPVVLTVPIFGLWRSWESIWENNAAHMRYVEWVSNTGMCQADGGLLEAVCYLFSDGLTDGRFGLILFYTALNLPFVIWLLIGFIQQIPSDLEEAAIMDGASSLQVFRRIISPLLRGGYAVAAIFVFRIAWNEFILGLILTNRNTYTLPVKTTLFIDNAGIRWGEIMSMGTLILIPPLLLTFFSARQIIQGMTAGAVKG